MSTRTESWTRLSGEAWLNEPAVQRRLSDKSAKPQRLSSGKFLLIKDEYRVEILGLPSGAAPEELVLRFADDPNGFVNHGRFNAITTFTRRPRGTPPAVGDMYILQFYLLGVELETGAIMTVMQSDGFGAAASHNESWFLIQALETEAQGSMPEFGAREFGLERDGARTFFYTRGASRGRDIFSSAFGKAPQQMLWRSAMQGIADEINAAGGRANPNFEPAFEVKPY